ncbi:Peroxidase 19 [Glycine soja]|nr:Peroxidase 19 [Glycine soja]
MMKKGRWDGKISTASRVASNIPHANSTVDQLIKLFTSKGLTTQDLAQPNRNMDPKLLHALRIYCPNFDGDSDIVAPFDATTQFLFDHAYYGNLLKKLGMLASDQALALEPRTKSIVQDLAKDKQKFIQAFVGAMDKLS